MKNKIEKYKPGKLDYEDYGTPGMFFFAILSIALMIGIGICFGIMLVSIFLMVSGLL